MLLQPFASVAASVAAIVALAGLPATAAAAGTGQSSARPAAVFAFPQAGENDHQHRHHDIPNLRPAEARLVFAERLGVSRFHKLGFQGQDMKVLELDRFSGQHTGLWRDQNENIVVVVSGVSNTKDIFPESKPAFFIADTPDAESFKSLANGFLTESQQLVGDLATRVFASSQDSFISVVPDLDLCIPGYEMTISRSQCVTSVEDIDLAVDFKATIGNDAVAAVFDAANPVDTALMSEVLAFNVFVDNFAQATRDDSQLAVLFFNSLNAVLNKYGVDSVQYSTGRTLFANLLQKLVLETAPSVPITTVLLPAGGAANGSASKKNTKRALAAGSDAFGDKHTSPAVSIGILAEEVSYPTEQECEIMTNFCSGHGTCAQLYGQEGYYSCACTSTYDEDTRQRTYWAGDYCQKTDVTVPFQIFFWFLIISLLFIAWTIKALLSIGNEELPAVLAAATLVPTKA
ncbi:hypothetical protein V1514DRAFT_275760 [Lipomyces japonicus]|uniref:uncharacterized protein n=1 Tax=Lipomyces japonicus TaxID=56871 RepID=UPI0034CE9210